MEKAPAVDYKQDLLTRLRSPRFCSKYLTAAMAESAETFLIALRNVVDAQKGMKELAVGAGVNRENLYRMLSEEGNPRLSSLASILQTLGFRLSVIPAETRSDDHEVPTGSAKQEMTKKRTIQR